MRNLKLCIGGEPVKKFTLIGGEVDITADDSEGWKQLAHYELKTEPDISENVKKGDWLDIEGFTFTVLEVDDKSVIISPC